jgi:hypothetical protein
MVDISHIPHVAYIKCLDRVTAYLILPDLYNATMAKNAEARKVPKERLEEIFKMFTSVLITLQPSEQAHLTETYDAEISRQSQMGRAPPGQGTHAIAPQLVSILTSRVLKLVRREPWGRNAFYLNVFRGMRSANVSTLEEVPRSPEDIIRNRFGIAVLPHLINWKHWYFDLGLELMLDGHVLMFRRDSLPFLLQKLLHIAEVDADAIVHTSKFEWDSAAQLYDAGGFRYEPSKEDQDVCGVTYVQTYPTEKHPIYAMSNSNSTALITFKDVMNNGAADYVERLIATWSDMSLAATSWNARTEIRVRGDKLHLTERLTFDAADLVRCLFMFPTSAWYRFKCIRLYGLSEPLMFWHRCTDPGTKSHLDSLQLVLACIWSINALNSRPLDWASNRALSDEVCPHERDRTDGTWRPVHDYQGLHFLAGISYSCNSNNGVGYLIGRTLDMASLQNLAGNAFSLGDLKRLLLKRPSTTDAVSQPAKRSNLGSNKGKPSKFNAIPGDFVNPFNLDEAFFETEGNETQSERLALILCQFQYDVIFKMPIHLHPPTYERINRMKLVQNLWPKAMYRRNIADVFRLCAFSDPSDALWDSCFEGFFPEVVYKFDLMAQNWRDFNFPSLWMSEKVLMTKDRWNAMRAELYKVWCEQITWAPLPSSDRAWTTKTNKRTTSTKLHSDDGQWTGACPIIVLNPRIYPRPFYDADVAVAASEW